MSTKGLAPAFWQDLYHLSLTASWPAVFGALAAFFVTLNGLFGTLYALAPGCIANLNPPGYLGAFFFSVETSATVGFGDMHPQTLYGHTITSIEIFVSIISIAMITGVMFARFSTPRSRVLFSRHAVVRPLDGQLTLMLRAANARQNVIVEASAHLRIVREEVSSEGIRMRRIRDLPLVREQSPAFVLSWTLMHVIDETSPLAGETHDSLVAAKALLVLTLTGIDETTGQDQTARTVYPLQAVRWNHAFRDILGTDEDGHDLIDYTHFHDVIALPSPLSHASGKGAGGEGDKSGNA
ncbi:MAG TPA: ion channel [Burkholderiaceae bacterium]|jgi:inward rectifier potassium channel|nr:ion channel [Burkholderiaceae bacterium]